MRSLPHVLLLAGALSAPVAEAQRAATTGTPLEGNAPAVTAPATTTPAPLPGHQPQERWYQIEVIVFRYRPRDLAGEPPVRPPVLLPDLSDALPLLEDLPEFEDEVAATPDSPAIPIAFQRLPENQLALAGVYRRLDRTGEVEPLLHLGWRQPSFGSDQARRIRITEQPPLPALEGVGNSDTLQQMPEAIEPSATALVGGFIPRFDGAVRLRVGRYLVFDADFVFQFDETVLRLAETRRVLFGETHYFDHPEVGLLVQVVPYQIEGAPSNVIEADVDDAIIDPDDVPIDELD